jgi:DNA-binding CsgD family transcriptional regulator
MGVSWPLVGRVGDWPLVGRVEELAACKRALGATGMGGVVLAGASGVGKTRLAREALATAQAAGFAPWWVVASRAAMSIPHGAVAQLVPPTLDGSADRFAVLQRTGEWLAASASGRRPVLGIDDAQWLDDGSAALIHHLVLTGVASVVVTVLSGGPVPDPVTALWKDGLAERVEVEALSRAETTELVEVGLGGSVDGLTVERLWQLSQGNALYLRELIRGGAATGALVHTGRFWRWSGSIRAAGRLVELLEASIGNLPVTVRQLVELVAFGEPLDVKALQQVGMELATVQAAEAAGLLFSQPAGCGIEVRLAHPLFGEALRARISPLRARAVYVMLTKTLTWTGATQPGDALRLAVWHLNAGTSCEPGLLVAGATAALAGFDYQLAERLARSAIAAGGGRVADQVLTEALVGQGRAEQAEVILAGLALDDVPDAAQAALARTRALNLHWGLGRPEEAEAVLTATEAAIADPARRDELVCLRAKFLQYAGCCADAVDLASEVLARPNPTEVAVSDSLGVLCQSLTGVGKYEQSIAVSERGVAFERRRHSGSWSMAEHEVLYARFAAYLWGGWLADAEALATSCYQRSVAICWPFGTAVWALWLGEAGRARGELTAALRWFREAAALVRGHDFRHPYCLPIGHGVLGCFGRAAAQAGEAAEAQTALADADALARPSTAGMNSFFGPIHAWVAVAQGEVTTGIELALKTAHIERHRGNASFEVIALHDVVRLGVPALVVRRLAELASVVEGRLAPLYADHAAAMAAADGAGLDAIAVAFAELGYTLLAAEAATQAAAAHQSAGCRARAGASAARARALATRCDGACTPALATLIPALDLTRREAEIARLAATGLSSRAIADRLMVAVRTVDNTLGAVYAKLGVGGRNELAAALVQVTSRT